MDVYSEIAPLLRVSRFLGLAPIEVTGGVGQRSVLVSRKYLACGGTIAVLLVIIKVHNVAMFQNSSFTPLVTYTVTFIKNIFDVGLVVLAVAVHSVNAKRVIGFLQNLDALDTSIIGIVGENTIDFKRGQIFVTFHVAFLFAFTVGGWFAIYHMFFLTVDENSEVSFGILCHWILFFSSFLINLMFATHFSAYVFLLRQRFAALKRKVGEMFVAAQSDEARVEPLVPKPDSLPSRDVASQTILRIRNVHFELCDLAHEINDIYSLLMLLFFASAFTGITVISNHCFEDARRILQGASSPVIKEFIAFCLCIVATLVVLISVLAGVCTSACHEANGVALPLHGLLASSSDMRLRTQAEKFSLQLLHRQLRFTAFGFFPIDATLLYAIVGGVSTYLVILIQFDLSLSQPKH